MGQVESYLFSVPQRWFKKAQKFLQYYPLPSSNYSDEDGVNDLGPLRITDAKKDEFRIFLMALAAM